MNVLESKYPILVLSYHNCEIYCCHLDGYKDNKLALRERMKKIEDEISSKSESAKFRIWYNLDENKLDKSDMMSIIESISRIQNHLYKIAFIGLHGFFKWRFEHMLKQALSEKVVHRAYFLDAEEAKGWLV